MILAGDIGGTNTRLALFEKDHLIVEQKFPSKKYKGLEDIVQEFLQTNQRKVERGCFGIAGPVRNEKCTATNLPWIVDRAHLREVLNIPFIFLLNDLEANAYGLRALKKEELFLLHPGKPQVGNQALISAGTGLGEAGIFWDGKEHHPFACEGGHVDFAPRNAQEFELLQYLQKKYTHVSYERVVSGPGLYDIYRFLIETKRSTPSSQVEKEMEKNDPPKVITKLALSKQDLACTQAVDWFLSFYGAEAGNLALKILSLGGLFIGGGIAPLLKEKFNEGIFFTSFCDKGRFKPLLESIPISIILNDDTALLGAAFYAEHVST